MKRFICSTAVASALLAVTVVPSWANGIALFGLSTEADTVYNDTYSFHVSTSENVYVTGSEFNIANFSVSGPFSVTITPTTTVSTTTGTYGNFFGEAMLTSGNYTFVISGTGNPGATLGNSNYGGSIFATSANVLSPISPTPIPGALVLFASGLGLLGFWGWNKGRKTESLEAVAC
jgi:hypothetical protein